LPKTITAGHGTKRYVLIFCFTICSFDVKRDQFVNSKIDAVLEKYEEYEKSAMKLREKKRLVFV
jgi:hypothetical protein